MEGDDDLSQLLFRLRLFNRVAQLPFFLIGCLSGLNNFELQSLELVKTDLMPNVVGVHEDQTAPALRVHEGGRRFRRRD